jgi:hypothetical protein
MTAVNMILRGSTIDQEVRDIDGVSFRVLPTCGIHESFLYISVKKIY